MDFKEVTNTGGPKGSNLEQYLSQVRYTANSPGIHKVNGIHWNTQSQWGKARNSITTNLALFYHM